jgi:hypothetical protein
MTNETDRTSPDDVSNSGGDDVAMSNPNTNSRIKVGVQTPGGLPEWLVNASIEDLTSPVMKREAPSPRGYRRT